MIKKILILLLTLLCAFAFVSCGTKEPDDNDGNYNPPSVDNPTTPGDDNGSETPTEKLNFSGITFVNKSVTYNGAEQSVVVSGAPNDATVVYSNNKGTNVGVYNASATISKEGYNDLTLTATLTINKAQMSGITLSNKEVKHTGENIVADYSGTLPQGSTVTYSYDNGQASETNVGVSEVGKHTIKIIITNGNYETLVLEAQLTIKSLVQMLVNFGKTVFDSFSTAPVAWEFLPQGLNKSNMVYNNSADLLYVNNTNVTSIPKNFIGKQLNVVYGVTDKMEIALKYISVFYEATDVIATAYQTHINDNPEDYEQFSGSVGSLNYSLGVVNNVYTVSCSIGRVSFVIKSDADNDIRTCNITLTDNTKLKMDYNDNYMKIAYSAFNVATACVEFIRDIDSGVVTGYVYHAEGYDNKVLQTTALITFDEDYTYIVGKKGDFAQPFDGDNRNCEVYDSKTGIYVGSEVYEDITTADYDTFWIPLYNIGGINTIRKVDESHEDNGKNKDTVYVNGSVFVPEYNTKLLVKTSRQYDIELKTVYVYNYDATEEEYTKVEVEIPMLFVQKPNLSTYLADIAENNNGLVLTNNQSSADVNAVSTCYGLIPAYNLIKENITLDIVKTYLGVQKINDEDVEE